MIKFEYRIRQKTNDEVEKTLNDMGSMGWELVITNEIRVWDKAPEDAQAGLRMIFKRPLA